MRPYVAFSIICASLACDERPEVGGDVATWVVQSDALLKIGGPDGEEPYLLHNVQDVAAFGNGRIAVANGGSQEIRIYGPDGTHLLTVGRAGDGPGEFRSLASVDITAADSIVALDSRLRRVSIFDENGVYARAWSFQSPGRGIYPSKARALDDRIVLVAFLRGRMPGDPPGLFRERAPVVKYSAEGEALGPLAQLPGEEWYYSEEQRVLMALPLGRGSHFATTRHHVYIGDGNDVTVYGADGDSLRTLRPFEARAVSRDDINAETTRRLASISPDARPQFRKLLADLPYPDTFPRYSRIVGGDSDNVWVEKYRAPADQRSTWHVLARNGEPIASLELPVEYIPYAVYGDTVIGVVRDSADVEYVVAYKVTIKGST